MNESNNYELYHHGIKGMKWGVRRFQKKDGSLTPAGKKRYDAYESMQEKKAAYKQAKKDYSKAYNKADSRRLAAFSPSKKHREANDARWQDALDKAVSANKARDEYRQAKKNYRDTVKKTKSVVEKNRDKKVAEFAKNTVKTGAALAGHILLVQGTYQAIGWGYDRYMNK